LLVFGDDGLVRVGLPALGVPALGAAGAGIASSVVSYVQMALLAEPVRRVGREEGAAFAVARWREALLRGDEVRRMLRVGMPMGLQFAFEVAFFSSVSVLMGRMGALLLAAHQVALSISSAPFHACLGIGSATSVVVGQRIGAGDQRGALLAGIGGVGLGFALMTTTGICFLLFPTLIVRAFTDDAGVIEIGCVLLRIAGFFALSDGVQAVASGALRGAGDTLWPFALHLCAHWVVGMPCALVFAFVLDGGAAGLWWGLTTGLTVSAVSLTIRFVRKARQGYVALEGSSAGGAR
jgi:MATE family multidrug resistance protein